MFYERRHPLDAGYYTVEQGRNFSYPLHIHGCFEILVVTEGEMQVTVGQSTRLLRRGEAALIFPNRIHGMKTPRESAHRLCVFSGELVGSYRRKVQGLVPREPFFTPDPLCFAAWEALGEGENRNTVKGILYLLCGAFDRGADYQPTPADGEDALLYGLLSYVEENFTGECTLRSLAARFTYDYAYLSKFFIRQVEMPFHEYVNRRRISEACRLLDTTGMGVLEIAESSGYRSLRTFNRNFRAMTGKTPAEYRRR